MEQGLENQYLDYASWKNTNAKLLDFLIKKNSKIIARFRYVLMVVDYLFDQVVFQKKKLREQGFYLLHPTGCFSFMFVFLLKMQ